MKNLKTAPKILEHYSKTGYMPIVDKHLTK